MMLAIFAYQNSPGRGRMVFSGERDEGKMGDKMKIHQQVNPNMPVLPARFKRCCIFGGQGGYVLAFGLG